MRDCGAMTESAKSDRSPEEIWRSCTRYLFGHGMSGVKETLEALAAEAGDEEQPDQYGSGKLVQDVESEIAELLGKEAAMFLPTGTMAQQVALRVWTERVGRPVVGFHPLCHLEVHEQHAYAVMHGLRPQPIGSRSQHITLGDLDEVREPLGALLLELPQRDLGGELPSWEELQAQIDWAHERGARVHMDGARLWEAGTFYERPYAEIAAGFDSVYVSFYKGLGALAGSALAGPEDFIEEVKPWVRRHGGNLFHFFPYVLSARKQLRERLPRFPEYRDRALQIAAVLREIPGIRVRPDPPQTNMMHLFLEGDREQLLARALQIAEEEQVALIRYLAPTAVPGISMFELTVGDAASELSYQEIGELFERVMGQRSVE
jgi:threonine aldolase